MSTSVLWLRRDLRLADHPALLAARDAADEVVPVFVLDDRLRKPSGPARLAFLYGCLRDLDARTDGALRVVHGRPAEVLARIAEQTGASSVHVSSDHGPYGRERDEQVRTALGEVPLVSTGSPYGVTPGTLTKNDGEPYKVFTPFAKAWRSRGVRSPALTPRSLPWSDGGVRSDGVPANPDLGNVELPEPGERAALDRWRSWRERAIAGYADQRNDPAVDGTSQLSVYLKYGCVHPRTLHADLGPAKGEQTFGTELIWRDFYADVLWHRPDSAREDWNRSLSELRYDEDDHAFTAWQQGRTGFPLVDAGMRQLLAQGWMHNRVRMVTASFLVKDLHQYWTRGARHFMTHLRDGDLASNNHGWQWVAGTGTDASPYFRVFNPVKQGLDHDPDGDYVRRWVPELRGIEGAAVHQPWTLPGGLPEGYPERIVDHDAERREALDRYQAARA